MPKFLELAAQSGDTSKIAMVVDMRSRLFFREINSILDSLEINDNINFKILFLDATDTELVSRYKETRRSHPLAADGRVLDGISLERELLAPLKSMSQNVVDTSELTPRQLPELRDKTGLDTEVYDYVMSFDESDDFYDHLLALIKPILPGYQNEGKSVLTVAIGCTGGQHRSTAFAHRLSEDLKADWTVNESHRDKNKRKETVNRS